MLYIYIFCFFSLMEKRVLMFNKRKTISYSISSPSQTSPECSQTSDKQNNVKCNLYDHILIWLDPELQKIKGAWVKQHPLRKQEHFANFSWLRNKGFPWKQSPSGSFRLIFSFYIGVVASPVMFPLQASTIMQLSDHNTELGKGSLWSLRVSVWQWNNFPTELK